MPARSTRKKAAKASRAASLAAAAKQPKITLKTRRTTVLFNADSVETLNLVTNLTLPLLLKPLKATKPPFTYIIVSRVVRITASSKAQELKSKTETVLLSLFNYAKFNISAFKLAVNRVKNKRHNNIRTSYYIYYNSPKGAIEF
jgi:hypothetical protein